jgi:hypothetical protein
MNELGQLLICNGISDWDPIENRIWCVLMHSGSPMAHTSLNITTVHRCMSHTVNLTQGAFIRALLTEIPNTFLDTHVGNPDEDEEDILKLISGMDEPTASNPFPPASLLYKIHTFVVKASLYSSSVNKLYELKLQSGLATSCKELLPTVLP